MTWDSLPSGLISFLDVESQGRPYLATLEAVPTQHDGREGQEYQSGVGS